TDATTIINVTNHSYFNLNGSGTILNHNLEINAIEFTPIDKNLIPTGAFQKVEGTPFDFRKSIRIGDKIEEEDDQLNYGGGYDHNFVLNKPQGEFGFAARAIGDLTGIILETFTDQPGIQFYSGNFMKGDNEIKGGAKDDYRTAFCLETQHFPDSPNQPHFPSTLLSSGEVFQSRTVYKVYK
ncbi:MAG TPA: hypothetical protein VM368_05520, partial [Flavisolibacter sp.]|nr:hypothetical protein [Flavisolibacter sp.]